MKNKELYMLYILGRSVINNDELCEAWGNKIKEIYCSSLGLKMISFVSFPQASEPSMNFLFIEIGLIQVEWHIK